MQRVATFCFQSSGRFISNGILSMAFFPDQMPPTSRTPMESLRVLLEQAYVKLPGGDVNGTVAKVKALCSGGAQNLLVISDFDMTLSRYYVNGKRGCTSYSVIENSGLMPEGYREKTDELRRKYAPMEANTDLTLEERTTAMEAWFGRAHELLVEYKLSHHLLTEIVSSANIALRSGCEQLFTMLEHSKVPLLIFSAGVADTILETLTQHSTFRSSMRVISNKILFDDSGIAHGFTMPVIHSYSKGKSPQQFVSVKEEIKGRHNLLLIGDSLGDPGMVGGLEQPPDHVIKVGFLNHDEEKLLTTYLELYDIVLTGDASMDIVNAIVGMVLTGNS